MKHSAVSIVLVFVLASTDSRAGDPLEDFPDAGAAQHLLDDARSLIQKNRYGEACPKLEESVRLAPATVTKFMLADCNERIGRLSSAWTGFLDVATQSKAANLPERERLAKKRAQSVESRLPKLVIEVPSAAPGLEVKRDGVELEATAWGTAIAVDPGAHRITATLPGKGRWVTTVTTTEGETVRVEVPRELPPPRVNGPRDPATALDDGTSDATPRDPATSLDREAPAAEIAGVLLGGLGAIESSGALVLLGVPK